VVHWGKTSNDGHRKRGGTPTMTVGGPFDEDDQCVSKWLSPTKEGGIYSSGECGGGAGGGKVHQRGTKGGEKSVNRYTLSTLSFSPHRNPSRSYLFWSMPKKLEGGKNTFLPKVGLCFGASIIPKVGIGTAKEREEDADQTIWATWISQDSENVPQKP